MNNEQIICKECNIEIVADTLLKKRKRLIKHIKTEHGLTYEQYVVKYFYNNERPRCECGCGNYVNFRKVKFNRFYGEHYYRVKSNRKKPKEKSKDEKINDMVNRLNSINLSISDIKKTYNDYVGFKDSMLAISSNIGFDKRTLLGYWRLLDLIENEDDFKRLTKKHRNYWTMKNPPNYQHIDENILFDIKTFIDNNPNKFTIKEIINKFGLDVSKLVLYSRLIEKFDENDLKSKLNTGNVSKPELEYFNILKYFYKDDIKQQFRLERKYYDYILLDKILIEFDGKYWHSEPDKVEKDKEKDRIAKKHGYYIIRVSDTESDKIEVLNKINKLYEKVKNSRNKK